MIFECRECKQAEEEAEAVDLCVECYSTRKKERDQLLRERDEARETAHAARRIADKHAATVLELRAMVERLVVDLHDALSDLNYRAGFGRTDAETMADKDVTVIAARALLERTKP